MQEKANKNKYKIKKHKGKKWILFQGISHCDNGAWFLSVELLIYWPLIDLFFQ